MKKGFTLIELLAVIVILAIIATIAVPIVLSIIEDTKESTTLRNAEYYLEAVQQSIAGKSLKIGGSYKPNTCIIQPDGNLMCDGEVEVVVDVKGKKPSGGTIIFDAGKISDITLNVENKVVTQNEKGEFVIGSSVSNDAPKTYEAAFSDNTWSEIADACQNNQVPDTWNVGDTLAMSIGEQTVEIVIIGKNHDQYADGSGTAPLTFMTKQIVGEHVMNSTDTNSGSWDGSKMYTYLNTELFATLGIKDDIKAVKKYTNLGGADTSNNATAVEESADKLFLLSNQEVFGSRSGVYEQEGSQYEYFANGGSNILYDLSSSVAIWWLRSPASNNGSHVDIVYSSGSNYSAYASSSIGVAFGFCF